MIIVYEADDLANFDGLEIFRQDELSNNFSLCKLSSFGRSSRDTRKQLRFDLLYDYASLWQKRKVLYPAFFTKRNSFSIIIFESRKKEERMDYYP